ncbi:unnamed protein product [Heterobilharzia americana]|nr:unnamed protein product [Heterobilharzia americana]
MMIIIFHLLHEDSKKPLNFLNEQLKYDNNYKRRKRNLKTKCTNVRQKNIKKDYILFFVFLVFAFAK